MAHGGQEDTLGLVGLFGPLARPIELGIGNCTGDLGANAFRQVQCVLRIAVGLTRLDVQDAYGRIPCDQGNCHKRAQTNLIER